MDFVVIYMILKVSKADESYVGEKGKPLRYYTFKPILLNVMFQWTLPLF